MFIDVGKVKALASFSSNAQEAQKPKLFTTDKTRIVNEDKKRRRNQLLLKELPYIAKLNLKPKIANESPTFILFLSALRH